MNYLTTALLRPQILPKLDFSKAIPEDCTTLVAVPALLLNEKQVRRLVDDLEVRFLANHDANLHFALLTDLPDSPVPAHEDDPLVDFCANLIDGLNEKYAGAAPPPRLQPARKSLDGMGAQARQADGSEQIPVQRVRQLPKEGRRHFKADQGPLRNHA
jgi:hypothetical protein